MFNSGEELAFMLIVAIFACMIEYFIIKWAVKDGIKESGILSALSHAHDDGIETRDHSPVNAEPGRPSHAA